MLILNARNIVGSELTGRFGGSDGKLANDKMVYKSSMQFEPLEANVTELTITLI